MQRDVVLRWIEQIVATVRRMLLGPDAVDPANDGTLVHMTGMATTAETLTDPAFDVSANALKLTRRVMCWSMPLSHCRRFSSRWTPCCHVCWS